ncbi:hypothetical protein SDC9_129024 [bioreactor metagenome]|uniref:Uncharacterized protein n=1 Tax=bioreactor metagenome TaxID=1076179 RepID=A0A645CXU8_9ZZZZ
MLEVFFQKLFVQLIAIPVLSPQLLQFLVYRFAHTGITGIVVDIPQLHRICVQVVQFPFIDVVIEMHQLVSFSSHAVMALHHVYRRILVIGVIDRVAPLVGFSGNQLPERFSLHLFRWSDAGIIEEGRCKI